MNDSARFLADIERFLVDTGMAATRFGEASIGNGHLVHRLRRGLTVRMTTVDKVYAFMRHERELMSRRRDRRVA